MNKREQMLEILKDTRDYYKDDPVNLRSVDKDGNCNYTWGNTHCAIGRYLKPEHQKEKWSCNNDSVYQLSEEYISDDNVDGTIDWAVREEVHGIDVEFWMRLQDFHDCRHHWDEHGVTDEGKHEYIQIQEKITGGSYD